MIRLYKNNMLYGYGKDTMLGKYVRKGFDVLVCNGPNREPIIDVDDPILLTNEVKVSKPRKSIFSVIKDAVDNTVDFFRYTFTPITAASLQAA